MAYQKSMKNSSTNRVNKPASWKRIVSAKLYLSTKNRTRENEAKTRPVRTGTLQPAKCRYGQIISLGKPAAQCYGGNISVDPLCSEVLLRTTVKSLLYARSNEYEGRGIISTVFAFRKSVTVLTVVHSAALSANLECSDCRSTNNQVHLSQ